MERIAALDLLRGAAALCVAIPHFVMLNGSVGWAEVLSVQAVEVFFVLSGFVLGSQILRCFHGRKISDLSIFLIRRWMRTIPPYLFALALITMIVGHTELADLARYALYAENVFAQHNAHDYFPVAWSLSIEEWFYVVFPGVLVSAAWWFRNSADWFAVMLALLFIAAVTLLRFLFGDLHDWGGAVRRVVVFRLDSIAYGFLLYMFARPLIGSPALPRAVTIPVIAILVAATTSLVAILSWRIQTTQDHFAESIFPLAAAAFGISAVLFAYSVRYSFERNRLIARCCFFMGQISYSLYLFHISVGLIVARHFSGLSIVAQVIIYVAICIALSAAFYLIFEQPILARRPNYRRNPVGRERGVSPVKASNSAVA